MTQSTTFNPGTGTWNDSLGGNFLWSRNNFGEGRPDVMAPFTLSVTDAVWRKISLLPGYSMAGNICGRFYANVSVNLSMLKALAACRRGNRDCLSVDQYESSVDDNHGSSYPIHA